MTLSVLRNGLPAHSGALTLRFWTSRLAAFWSGGSRFGSASGLHRWTSCRLWRSFERMWSVQNECTNRMESYPRSGENKRRSRSAGLARGMFWASRASSVGFQFVVPAGIGAWVDHSYECSPWGVVVGAVLGFVLGFRELFQLVRMMDRAGSKPNRPANSGSPSTSGPTGHVENQVREEQQ